MYILVFSVKTVCGVVVCMHTCVCILYIIHVFSVKTVCGVVMCVCVCVCVCVCMFNCVHGNICVVYIHACFVFSVASRRSI